MPFSSGGSSGAAAASTFGGSGVAVDVTNSVAETDLVSFTVPAGALGANGVLRVNSIGDLLQNSATNYTLRVKAGSTALWGITSLQSSSATRRAIDIACEFGNRNGAALNALNVSVLISDGVAADVGTGALGRALAFQGGGNNSLTVNTASSWTFSISVQWAGASTNLSWRSFYYDYEYARIL